MHLYNTGVYFLNRKKMVQSHEHMEKFNQNPSVVMELNFSTIWSMQVKQSWDVMEQAFSHQ